MDTNSIGFRSINLYLMICLVEVCNSTDILADIWFEVFCISKKFFVHLWSKKHTFLNNVLQRGMRINCKNQWTSDFTNLSNILEHPSSYVFQSFGLILPISFKNFPFWFDKSMIFPLSLITKVESSKLETSKTQHTA